MLRSIVNGVLVLAVVGGAYWYLSAERQEESADLINTPRPSSLKGPEHSRVAKAKASLKTATRPEPASKKGPKIAKADEDSQKDSSNKAFAGLKASSLVKPKPKPKPNAAAKTPPTKGSTKLVASKDRVDKPAPSSGAARVQKNKALAGVAPRAKVSKTNLTVSTKSSAPVKMDAVTSTPIEGFSLRRVALANEVENREPSGVATSFDKGTRVHLFMDAKNMSDDDLELVVRWHDPALADPVSVSLKVPAHAGRYRTWANSSPIHHLGTHEVSVQVKDGPEIYRKSFRVAAANAPEPATLRAAR